MYNTILVPTDGSEQAARAVEHGMKLAEQYDATLHTMFVVDTRRYGDPTLSSTELIVEEMEDVGTDLVTDIEQRATDRGLAVVSRVCHGVPDEEIVAYATEINADIIVLGAHGKKRANRIPIGSVAERVVRTADRPVLTT
ncbi:universal stress protein [Haladaptatus sp. ZSTT2]|uniref:universal stress protein n=1 Tax=Haladaptatus sp. ZSTT2 TaxID=3120515 RepID=UPI00300F3EC9